jgi:hypothetical protein
MNRKKTSILQGLDTGLSASGTLREKRLTISHPGYGTEL